MILNIATYLPQGELTNEELSRHFPDWPAEKIFLKTGILNRRVTRSDEFSSDIAAKAALRLLQLTKVDRSEIDFLLLTTQTPDYLLPTTACLVQEKIGLPKSIGALDINLGCSAYVYALSLAESLIETDRARKVLVITADTYTKLLSPDDKSVRTLFGDAATATLVGSCSNQDRGIYVFGTDGSGAKNLIYRKQLYSESSRENSESVDHGSPFLSMNGPEILTFALSEVPRLLRQLMEKANCSKEDIDLFLFHQANGFILEALRKKLGIPQEKLPTLIDVCGNTVSSSLPLLIADLTRKKVLESPKRVVLIGFGVGYSWAGVCCNLHLSETDVNVEGSL